MITAVKRDLLGKEDLRPPSTLLILLSLMKGEEDATCSECAEVEDTFFHLLEQCPVKARMRYVNIILYLRIFEISA